MSFIKSVRRAPHGAFSIEKFPTRSGQSSNPSAPHCAIGMHSTNSTKAMLAMNWLRFKAAVVTIELSQLPPSANAIWIWTPRGIARSQAYRGWRDASLWELKAARPAQIAGPYALHLRFNRTYKGGKADLGNLEKATSDVLQAAGVIEDDKHAQHIESEWVSDGPAVWARVIAKAEAA